MKSLIKQNKILEQYLGITVKLPKNIPEQHPEADGIYLIPDWQKLGKTYSEALGKVMEAIVKTRDTYYWRKSSEISRINPAVKVPEILSCQLGEKYKGKSVQSVRENIPSTEILLGAYEIGIILLTHPDALKSYNDPWIDCAADQFVEDSAGAPFWFFSDGKLEFDAGDVSCVDEGCGAGSGFVPQSKLATRSLDSSEFLTLEARVKSLEEDMLKIKNMFN